MPPKAAPPPASASSKGKGKEAAASTTSSSNATSTATSTNANSASTPSTNAAAAAQRRQPIGKVIHYFADNQSQGYDGLAFQEAYRSQILAKVQELQDAKKDEKPEESEIDVKEEDLQAFISLTGLKSESAKEYFVKAKSTKVEDACKAYLHPENFETGTKTIILNNHTNDASPVVPAAA